MIDSRKRKTSTQFASPGPNRTPAPYEVQYWVGDGDAMDEQDKGTLENFPSGTITDGKGGIATLRLDIGASSHEIRAHPDDSLVEHLRHSWLRRSPQLRGLCHPRTVSRRHSTTNGKFNDLLHHSPDQKQTLTYCSSVDPWHEPSDLYVAPDRMESGDQPGFDLFFTSGITRGLPAIVPVAMLYSTPEDAAAQMAYIKEARLSRLLHRDGRRTRRPVHAARRLRHAVSAVRDRAASRRSATSNWAGRSSKA